MALKIACGQIEIVAGRPDINTNTILEQIKIASQNNIDILLLPELAISGYLIGDLWEQTAFINDCVSYGHEVIAATKNYPDLCVIFGNIALDPTKKNEDGHIRKYNAAFVAQNGKLLANKNLPYDFFIKTSLPNYRAFDDSRYFYGLQQLALELTTDIKSLLQPLTITVRNESVKLGLLLCEDSWTSDYLHNIPQILTDNGAEILCNLSSSPFTLKKNNTRNRILAAVARQTHTPLLYCNNTGIQNNGKNIFTYDGRSSIYDSNGQLLADTPMYSTILLTCLWSPQSATLEACNTITNPLSELEEIYQALRYGCQKFLQQAGISKMTIGLSGGIDSAVTAALYVDILGPDNVLLVNMPSHYNSETTQHLAEKIALNLQTNYTVIPIHESYKHTIQQITTGTITNSSSKIQYTLKVTPLICENIQARDRGARVIAGLSSAFGGAFSCNSNKTELAIGYATLYGDICGALAVIGDLWKHHVYQLGAYLNTSVFQREVIPQEVFTIRPSAELSPEQTVGTGGDPLLYEYHDKLFAAWLEPWSKISPEEILEWYQQGLLGEKLNCDESIIQTNFLTPTLFIADLEYWWKLFCGLAVAKRIQSPPVITITRRGFGYDYREAQLSPYFSKQYLKLKAFLLNKNS